ncbi:hypothetical protein DXC94_07195 [Streptococcus anginosus]|uniref:hypothetical protein n=1 Tax=Streptococcus TaxID=1301 RepID=UPI0005E114AD|nr:MULTISPECIES: hypothetical protein [Streptococcus]RGK71146.1 hypothetical protein DXC94_07195 [Streptococcus anginosus]CNJ64881.1 Uncharacterised protein [Streptococcus agalactiae]
MEKYNLKVENKINLLEVEQRMITSFREMIPHVHHLADLFLKERFDITLPITPEENLVYDVLLLI